MIVRHKVITALLLLLLISVTKYPLKQARLFICLCITLRAMGSNTDELEFVYPQGQDKFFVLQTTPQPGSYRQRTYPFR